MSGSLARGGASSVGDDAHDGGAGGGPRRGVGAFGIRGGVLRGGGGGGGGG